MLCCIIIPTVSVPSIAALLRGGQTEKEREGERERGRKREREKEREGESKKMRACDVCVKICCDTVAQSITSWSKIAFCKGLATNAAGPRKGGAEAGGSKREVAGRR